MRLRSCRVGWDGSSTRTEREQQPRVASDMRSGSPWSGKRILFLLGLEPQPFAPTKGLLDTSRLADTRTPVADPQRQLSDDSHRRTLFGHFRQPEHVVNPTGALADRLGQLPDTGQPGPAMQQVKLLVEISGAPGGRSGRSITPGRPHAALALPSCGFVGVSGLRGHVECERCDDGAIRPEPTGHPRQPARRGVRMRRSQRCSWGNPPNACKANGQT